MPTIDEVLQQGWKLHQSGNVDDAEQVYRNVLARVPRNANALVYLGIALFDQRRFEESVAAYREALTIQDQFPIAWNNLGNSCRMLGLVDEAERCFAKSLHQQPGYLSALKNRGTLWVWTGDIERGKKWYEQGLQIDPNNAELHRNLGVINLLLGDDEAGWREYRWRWQMPGTYRPAISAPIWRGEDLAGKTIVLYPEQGRGDAIQFLRVASVLRDQGAAVIVETSAELIPLFTSAPGIDLMLPAGAALPPADYQASLIDVVDVWYSLNGELPYASDLFSDHRGYLDVPEALDAYWQRWIDHYTQPRRIGINWQGNPDHHADIYRSLPLRALRPLSEIDNVTLINLQFGPGAEQLQQCDFADSILRLPENLDTSGGAFSDTAAILKKLDRVVTSDTAVAHLAGALGVDVTVMLGKVPDWRWRLEGERTPWYPSMRLVRQSELGRWDDVVQQVVEQITSGLSA